MRYVWLIAIFGLGAGVVAVVLHSRTPPPPVPVVKPMLLWEKTAGPRRSKIYVAFSPDGRYLASGTNKGDVRLWDPETGKLLRTVRVPNDCGWHITFSPDSRYLATSSQSSTLLIDVRTGRPAQRFRGGAASSLSFSPDGKLLAGGGDKITIWDTSSGAIIRELGRSDGVHGSAAFSAGGGLLAYGDNYKSHDNEYIYRTRLWDVRQGKVTHTLDGAVAPYAFSSDGSILAAGVAGGVGIRAWDVRTGERLEAFADWRKIGCPWAVGFSPDGKLIAIGGSAVPSPRKPLFPGLAREHPPYTAPGGTITLSDAQTGRILWKEKVSRIDRVFSIDILPDGKLLAAGVAWDAKVMVWRLNQAPSTPAKSK